MRGLASLSGVRPAARLARRRPGVVLLLLAGAALVLAWPARGKEPGVPRFPDYVSAVAFSPDGKTLAVAEGNIISLWELASGEDRLYIRAYGTIFLSVSPDGRH